MPDLGSEGDVMELQLSIGAVILDVEVLDC